jgi:hypothetical protein
MPTLSFHLKGLLQAGLVGSRDGRNLYYRPNFERMNGLVAFLTENCCSLADESCGPTCQPQSASGSRRKTAGNACCCAPERAELFLSCPWSPPQPISAQSGPSSRPPGCRPATWHQRRRNSLHSARPVRSSPPARWSVSAAFVACKMLQCR